MYSSSGQFVRIATHGAAVTTAVILDAFPKGEDHDGALPATPRLGIHDARGQKVNQCLDDDDTLPLRRARAYAVLERVLAKGEPRRLVKPRHLGTCPSLINIHTYSTMSLSYTHPSFSTPGIWSSISVPS
jgi:hypothetical protein